MKKYLSYIFLALSSLTANAIEPSYAYLKAEYEAWNLRDEPPANDPENPKKNRFILQIAPGSSYYYDPQTFYVDSLKHDPNGRAIYDQAFEAALDEFMRTGADALKIMKEKGLMSKDHYRCRKDFESEEITIWNDSGADKYKYTIPMSELTWELSDSTTTVLGYECSSATADYHGRRWRAWFALDIAVQDGPWQLCGLPGLILKAETMDGNYGFEIKGLQKCNEPLKDPFEDDKTFKTKRKSYLKMRDHTLRNRAAQIKAMTGGNVNLSDKIDYKGKDDFLETDYHE
ncbi:MAG: GLPGLI family protein [Muribaculaceae bacterium]|nr:GLPGLI family protein [Muribaculaceae bacterium]MDE6796062.1 GLPGLI family protein [Muribaculaceae bacterium]